MGTFFSHVSCCRGEEDLSLNGISSMSRDLVTQREKMATWYRFNIAVTDVYEIIKTIGLGRMGEVYHVRRKDGGRVHTEETKKKEEEAASSHSLNSIHGTPDELDLSIRSLNFNERGRKLSRGGSLNLSSRNSKSTNELYLLDLSTRSRSKSPFSSSRSKKRNMSKKNAETLALAASAEKLRKEIEERDNSKRKLPPDLTTVLKPKPILKKPSHGITTSSSSPALSVIDDKSVGMTSLITGKALNGDDDDSSDTSVPMNIEAVSPQNPTTPRKTTSIASAANAAAAAIEAATCNGCPGNHDDDDNEDNSTASRHPTFALTDESSVVSEVTYHGEDINKEATVIVDDSIVTGDATPEQKKKGDRPKKWVPRRRVFFRRHYACKTIATENIKKEQMEELLNEIYMMRKMDHPYIIRLYEVYQVERKIWLVMDLCNGGDLHSRKLNENQVTVVTEQILRGVAYLHQRGICHRDLKMENILYENKKDDSTIRLIDFGLSLTYDRIDAKQNFAGAAYTLSPEVLSKKPYTEKSDIWSIGIIIWVMLAGDYPFIKEFEDLKNESMKKKLEHGAYSFGITWRGRGITECAKEFVRGCLTCDPTERWTALQALEYMQDVWIPKLEEKAEEDAILYPIKKTTRLRKTDSMKLYSKERLPPPSTIATKRKKSGHLDLFNKDILVDIKRFADYSLFKKTILVTMANTMDSKDVGKLRELFLMIDTNQSGTITLPELKDALHKIEDPDLDDENVENIFAAIDYDGSGHIHYAEFIAAFSESQDLITHDRLEDSFDRIDSTGKGYISHDDLKNILGENHTKEAVNKMIEEGDFKKNGKIDFDEFLQLMTDS